MPSKPRKQQPKTPSSSTTSSSSNLKPPPSPSTPSTPLSLHYSNDNTTLLLNSSLEQASNHFPSPFISPSSSLVCQLSEFDTSQTQKGCKIWLSESSFLHSSLSPGSLVSVSLASLGGSSACGFPLSSWSSECREQFGVTWEGEVVEKPGKYFALATALPSSKLQKNGVRLSSTLSCSLGFPASGRFVFVHSVNGGSLSSLLPSNGKFCSSNLDHSFLYHCKELYIRLISIRKGLEMDAGNPLLFGNSSDKSLSRIENGNLSSPQTPLSKQSRPRSPSPSKFSSLSSDGSASHMNDIKGSCLDSVDMHSILGDETAKKLLHYTALSYLCSRTLLCGNLVTVPVLSRLCAFEVVGAKILSADGTDQVSVQTDKAFMIDQATKVHICLESDVALDISVDSVERSSATGEISSVDVNAKMGDEAAKLWKEYTPLREIISSAVKNSLSSLGLRTTKGVLLHGPPGTGKTSLAHLCANDAGVNFFKVNGPEVISQYYGESEQALSDVFKEASEATPSVVFIDELDAIAPARKEGGEDLSYRMVATLLNLMDGVGRTEGLLVVAATNRVECIEPALRRPGRFDREIEIGVPSTDQRTEILKTLLGRMENSLHDEQIKHLAKVTHGFVGADLIALVNEAAMVCLRRSINSNKPEGLVHSSSSVCDGSDVIDESSSTLMDHGASSSDDDTCYETPADVKATVSANDFVHPTLGYITLGEEIQKPTAESDGLSSGTEGGLMKITFEDIELARVKIRPSAMREVILEVPKVDWEDVGGQEEVKAQLMETVEWPQKHQDAFKRIGTRPPNGVLMFGPPGCSKTLMARAVASKAGLNFLAVKGPELFSKWVGESEKAVRSVFAKARANAPSIIFFDEIDSLAVIRGTEGDRVSVADRVMSQLLVELDGLHERVNVTVIAATNRPDKIDPALLRPGRFDRLLYVGPPNENDRVEVFRVHLRKMTCSSDVDLRELARLTGGCTGADISLICREAAILAIEENLAASEINMEHLKIAIQNARPSEIQPYQELSERFQRLVYAKTQSNDLACQPPLKRREGTLSWKPVTWIQRLACWFQERPR